MEAQKIAEQLELKGFEESPTLKKAGEAYALAALLWAESVKPSDSLEDKQALLFMKTHCEKKAEAFGAGVEQ